jgi:hypothetical protein
VVSLDLCGELLHAPYGIADKSVAGVVHVTQQVLVENYSHAVIARLEREHSGVARVELTGTVEGKFVVEHPQPRKTMCNGPVFAGGPGD